MRPFGGPDSFPARNRRIPLFGVPVTLRSHYCWTRRKSLVETFAGLFTHCGVSVRLVTIYDGCFLNCSLGGGLCVVLFYLMFWVFPVAVFFPWCMLESMLLGFFSSGFMISACEYDVWVTCTLSTKYVCRFCICHRKLSEYLSRGKLLPLDDYYKWSL